MHVYTKWSQNGTCKEENKYEDTKSRHKYASIDIVTISHAFNRLQNNKCFMHFLPYIQYAVISKSNFSTELIQRQSLLFIQAFKVVQG